MTKTENNLGRWEVGKSGNPKGRPQKSDAISEILRHKAEDVVVVGGQTLTAKEALAEAVWRFALTGEVMLAGKHLKAESVNDWVQAVKWLYGYVAPPQGSAPAEAEMVVRVVRGKTSKYKDKALNRQVAKNAKINAEDLTAE